MPEDIIKSAEEIVDAEERIDKVKRTIEFMLEEYGDILFTKGILKIEIPFEIKDEELSRIKIKYNCPLEIRYGTIWDPYEKITSGVFRLINPNFKSSE